MSWGFTGCSSDDSYMSEDISSLLLSYNIKTSNDPGGEYQGTVIDSYYDEKQQVYWHSICIDEWTNPQGVDWGNDKSLYDYDEMTFVPVVGNRLYVASSLFPARTFVKGQRLKFKIIQYFTYQPKNAYTFNYYGRDFICLKMMILK